LLPFSTPSPPDTHTLSLHDALPIWLDPKTGEMKLIQSATPRSNPYGVVVSSKGMPHIVLFGTNKIAAIDPLTMEIKEYVLPNAEDRKSTRLNSSHDQISYAVFCLKK